MATILLNESDPMRHELLRQRLQRQGHKVWSASHLNDIIATLHDVAIDLMILDLDHQRLDDLAAFADRWKGIKILFQASSPALLQDFRETLITLRRRVVLNLCFGVCHVYFIRPIHHPKF